VRRRERERDYGASERRERAGARGVERAEEDQRAQPGGKRRPHGASISLICTSPSAHNSSAALARLGRARTGAVYSQKYAPDGGRRTADAARAPGLAKYRLRACVVPRAGCARQRRRHAARERHLQRRKPQVGRGAWSDMMERGRARRAMIRRRLAPHQA
jgi:hypothetical protein